MEEIRDYYAFLGVPRDATADDIKRAYARKRREYQNDEAKSTQLNQAYDVLCDSAKRKQYDLNMQFGSQVENIREKIQNSETLEQRNKYLIEARKLYLDILKTDAENIDALWNLVGIEESLGNDTQAIQYLKQLEKYTEGDDKVQVYHRMGEIYRNQKKVDEAIKCYYAIYKADAAYVDDIKILVRLCYEDKKNLKAAIQILNDCINRSTDSRIKIVYLYETLRAIRVLKVSSYQKVEETLYKKLESFRTDNEESNLANAAAVLTCFEDVLDREDYECFHRLEQIYQAYGINHVELNQAFKAVQQIVSLMESGKLHKAIELYLEEQWTKELRGELGKLIIKEAELIKESLELIKKMAPDYWKANAELADLEKLVNDNLRISREFKSLSNDRTISYHMKKMMEYILLDGFVAFDDIKDEFVEVRDAFFEKEDKDKVQHTLRKMEEFYPLCYKIFANIFFDGKSTEEVLNQNNRSSSSANTTRKRTLPYFPNAKEGYEHKPYIEGFLELVFIVIGTCCFPPALPVIFISKYYSRHQKSILKVLKRVLAVVIPLLIVIGICAVTSYVREKQYEENHNNILTESELQKVEQLENEYAKKTGVNIIYIQSEESQIEVNGNYILLSYYINHPIWDSGYGIHTKGILTQEQTDELGSEVYNMLDDDSLSDYDKCERFFEIAYDYIIKNDISEQKYVEDMQNQEKLKSYSITQDGIYDVGYNDGLISPGSYKVKAEGEIDNQFNLVYLTIYRNGVYVGQYPIGSFSISITLNEGDELDVSYNGKGSYNLVLYEDANQDNLNKDEPISDENSEANQNDSSTEIPTEAGDTIAVAVDDFEGTWWDTDSLRCNMAIQRINSTTISVIVAWGSSAFETTFWEMTAIYNSERNVYEYMDCKKTNVISDENASEQEEICYESGTGYIYLYDGFLYWEDNQESVRNGCAFEKSPY